METVEKKIEMAAKRSKEDKMAKQIKVLRNDWRDALLADKDNKEVITKENRYHWYVEGIKDALGFSKICELVTKSREV